MKFVVYTNELDNNDATSFYLKVIVSSIEEIGGQVEYTSSWKELSPKDYIIIINYKQFFKAYYLGKCRNIIFWFQGILPEELRLSERSVWNLFKRVFFTKLEKKILDKSSLLFFVSEAMRNHFVKKWHYKKTNYIVMPCFNKEIIKESFFYPSKYLNLTFVYAGTLSPWQCIDETLDIYKCVEQKFDNAKLILLTQDQEKAKEMVLKKELKNVEINYFPLEVLDDELQKYKYAFLIRKNIDVNRVATPTKMSTYLANGLIPIYSNVIEAFSENLTNKNCFVSVEDNFNNSDLLKQIEVIENQAIDPAALYALYTDVFEVFYNTTHYKRLIESEIQRVCANAFD